MNLIDLGHDALAQRGQSQQTLAVALEQRRTEFGFQQLQLATDCRLHDVHFVRGLAEIELRLLQSSQ